MSTVTAPDTATAPPKKGKKKLLIMVGAAVLVLGLAGGGAAVYLKKKAAAEAEAEADSASDSAGHGKASAKRDPKAVPTFVPLDPFTVNLADKEAERFAQVGVSLELTDAHAGDQIKLYMPVIRNNILMVLAHKTSSELLERDGKTKLAADIQRETSRALGFEPAVEEAEPDTKASADEDEDKPKKKKKKKAVSHDDESPVKAVHFSNFIIQ